MRNFLRFVAIYFLAGIAFVALVRDDPVALIGGLVAALPATAIYFMQKGWWLIAGVVALFFVLPRGEVMARLPRAFLVLMVCNLFFLTFTMVKTSLPYAMPFWADPPLAALDRALHLGVDPYVLTHAIGAWIPPAAAVAIYMGAWIVPAMYLPVILVLFDGDRARVGRFLLLYAVGWALLGSVLALGGLSAGPIYYDRLLGGDRFAGLIEALAASGISASMTGQVQDFLWGVYASGAQGVGSGISAFPSVHVGMACVVSLYLYERARWLAPLSVAITGVFLFLSVHLGWHYAVDGYASIAVILATWAVARRRQSARPAPELADLSPETI
ncbi:phosphatase PAP2 family protein [Vannielia litorea]|uniref:phosphatase PAP2 family protein n=1 Tax=Vannielia litorea TaxID=1217970 RepID=UPI001C962547|nr:phosphatase PAP2 family protein [Vannielia litorea]MBY6049590.1 phosphatase PAP2 family protein [Vannielia litorea]MBY6077004.1 phosphatase PAP2 family protein [Vannielia litorea]